MVEASLPVLLQVWQGKHAAQATAVATAKVREERHAAQAAVAATGKVQLRKETK